MLSLSLRVAGAISAVAVWWFGAEVLGSDSLILSNMGPADALSALIKYFDDGQLTSTILVSLERLFAGLALAATLGITLGLVIGSLKRFEQLTLLPIQFLRMISPLAWMPVAVVLFGIGSPPVVFLIAIAAIWPISVSTAAGVRALDPKWFELAKSLRANRLETLTRIVVPGIRPHVLTGLRLALGLGWVVLVPAEMLGVDSGLGYQILNARDQLAYDQLAAIMLLIGLLGFVMDWLAQRLFARWVK